VLLGVVVLVCAGAVAVPATWAVRRQVEAERGEAAPEAAANVWVLQASAGEEIGLSRVLSRRRRDELLAQWRAMRADMSRGRPPSKMATTGLPEITHQGDNRAVVVWQVQGIWWNGPLSMASAAHPWRFEVHRERGGWRIWSVDLPAWCGVYVRANACA
jgi:hypothetical protein